MPGGKLTRAKSKISPTTRLIFTRGGSKGDAEEGKDDKLPATKYTVASFAPL